MWNRKEGNMADGRAKSCQECGSGMTAVIHKRGNPDPSYSVLCGYCPTATQPCSTRQAAISAWNAKQAEGGNRG